MRSGDVTPAALIERRGRVAGGEYALDLCSPVYVDRHSVSHIQPAADQPADVRVNPGPDDDVIDLDARAVRQAQCADHAVCLHPIDRHPGADVDALGRVEAGEPPAELGPEHARERAAGRLDERHIDAQLAGGGGNLEPDEAGADHRQSRARGEHLTQRPSIVELSEHGHVVVTGEHRQRARTTTRADQQLLVAQGGVVGKLEPAFSGVESRRR